MSKDDLRLFMLTVIGKSDRTIYYCKTVAASLDDAVQQAASHYGPVELNAWGTRHIDPEYVIHGGGAFIPSANDALLTPEQLSSITS